MTGRGAGPAVLVVIRDGLQKGGLRTTPQLT